MIDLHEEKPEDICVSPQQTLYFQRINITDIPELTSRFNSESKH